MVNHASNTKHGNWLHWWNELADAKEGNSALKLKYDMDSLKLGVQCIWLDGIREEIICGQKVVKEGTLCVFCCD